MEALIVAFICWGVAFVTLRFRERIVTEFREGWVTWMGFPRPPANSDLQARLSANASIALFFVAAILCTLFGIAEVTT